MIEISRAIVAEHPNAGRAWYRIGVASEKLDDWSTAAEAFGKAAKYHYMEDQTLWEATLLYAKLGSNGIAFEYLNKLARFGFDNPTVIEKAPELVPFRSDSQYVAALRRMKANIGWQSIAPRWSKDGKLVIFQRGTSDYPPTQSEVFAIHADGTGETQLTFGPGEHMMPDISPDGTQLVYSSGGDGQRKLFIENLKTHQARPLLGDQVVNAHFASWSPDGQTIAFNTQGKGNRQIGIVHIDGGGFALLTDGSANSDFPRWTPDHRLTFESDRAGMWDAYIMQPDGSVQTRLAWASTPTISPDGKFIAYSDNVTFGVSKIMALNLETRVVKQLTADASEDWEPDWSPDGKKIVFMSKRHGPFELYVMDADGSHVRRLTYSRAPLNKRAH